jgi:hypothetical protein
MTASSEAGPAAWDRLAAPSSSSAGSCTPCACQSLNSLKRPRLAIAVQGMSSSFSPTIGSPDDGSLSPSSLCYWRQRGHIYLKLFPSAVWIRDVFIPDPDFFSFPDPGSSNNKKSRGGKIVVLNFYVAIIFTKLKITSFSK